MRPLQEIIDAVRAWRESKCAQACPQCPINCCEGRLNPRLDSLAAFEQLPVVRGGDRPPPDTPYVADRRVLFWGDRFLVGRCPHLECGRCAIYADPRRPRECHEYPLHVQPILGGWGGGVISAERSCWIFQQAENCEAVRELAKSLGVDCILHAAS